MYAASSTIAYHACPVPVPAARHDAAERGPVRHYRPADQGGLLTGGGDVTPVLATVGYMGLLAFVENFRKVNKVPKPDLKTVNIEELFGNLQSFLQEEFRTTDIVFTLEEHFTMEVDEQLISQVLINLGGNAIKFSNEGDTVSLKVTIKEEDESTAVLQFSVQDTGIGLFPEQQEKLFQPFTQADGSTTRQHGGTGLGLAISERIVRDHGGTIEFSSTLGEGTTVTVAFPKTETADPEEAQSS